jgi:hypothetical protein
MANYTPITNFAVKDTLPNGDPLKRAKGADIQVELNAIAAAIQTKGESNDAAFTGTISFENIAATGDVSFQNIIASNIDCGTY